MRSCGFVIPRGVDSVLFFPIYSILQVTANASVNPTEAFSLMTGV